MSYEIYLEMVDLINKIDNRAEKATDILALLMTIKKHYNYLFSSS